MHKKLRDAKVFRGVDTFHFIIFERETEEESILTITQLLRSLGYRVSVFISPQIAELIKKDLLNLGVKPQILSSSLEESLQIVDSYIVENNVDLVFFTRYSAKSYKEYRLFKKFVERNSVCSLIESYDRWLKVIPPLKFNGWKIIKRSRILDWYYCTQIMKDFSSYFISDIHPESINPLKQIIKNKYNKPILDFPFKIMNNIYNPSIKYEYPVFVVPGSIDINRRNYNSVLEAFSSDEVITKRWKLIFLGRPIGDYGNRIIKKADDLNKRIAEKKIFYFNNYISKKIFDKHMNSSTHILAPINPNGYKYGKDSGALYDIFKYNKIGIMNKKYFYSNNLTEIKSILTFFTNEELIKLLSSIINNEIDPNKIYKNISNINMCFLKQNYVRSLEVRIPEVITKISKNK